MSDPLPGSLDAVYVPDLSAEEIEQIRSWHESAYERGRAEGRATQSFQYLGLSLVVPPDVMPVAGVAHLLGEAVLAEVSPEDTVLDMGTGSGVNAILAASSGAHVVAVDINQHALEAAQHNAERNGVAELVELRHSDVFSAVPERFDLIVFDPPFRWFAPRDIFEAAMTDENYGSMTSFFRQARRHLAPGGRMLVFFGTSGDIEYLNKLIFEEGFTVSVVAHGDIVRQGHLVEYFTFLVR